MMTSAQVVETSVNVTSNSPSQDSTHPDDHNLPNYSTNNGSWTTELWKGRNIVRKHCFSNSFLSRRRTLVAEEKKKTAFEKKHKTKQKKSETLLFRNKIKMLQCAQTGNIWNSPSLAQRGLHKVFVEALCFTIQNVSISCHILWLFFDISFDYSETLLQNDSPIPSFLTRMRKLLSKNVVASFFF